MPRSLSGGNSGKLESGTIDGRARIRERGQAMRWSGMRFKPAKEQVKIIIASAPSVSLVCRKCLG
jgi:hypothetical protein